jgi:hypothetical protein
MLFFLSKKPATINTAPSRICPILLIIVAVDLSLLEEK